MAVTNQHQQILIFSVLLLNSFRQVFPDEIRNESAPSAYPASYSVFDFVYPESVDTCEYNKNTSVICVRKCCALDYTLKYKVCVFDNVTQLEVPLENSQDEVDLHFLPGMANCVKNYTKFKPEQSSLHKFSVQNNGRLWIDSYNMSFEHYCIDYFENGGVSAYVCVHHRATVADRLDVIGMAISLPFLLVTFIVYALLPDRNLHGTCLMCYVFTLFGVYLMQIVMWCNAFAVRNSFTLCKTLLILNIYFFMVSLYWMNVMAFDIWSTLTGWQGVAKTQTPWTRFWLYSLYAWTFPLLQIIIIIIISNTADPHAWYNPNVQGGYCSIKPGYPELLYWYGPMAILIIINIVLFGITACTIRNVQKEAQVLRGGSGATRGSEEYDNTKRFKLYVKLMFAMGVNWSMEIIPWALEWKFENIPEAVWYLAQFCNAAFGVFIFFIFVFKKRIWKSLKKRYHMIKSKKY